MACARRKSGSSAHDVAHEWVDAARLRSVDPSITPSALGGLLVPTHGFVNARSFVTALQHSARLHGASFESPVEVVEIAPQAGGVEVRAGARRERADAVVMATGCWSGRVRVRGTTPPPVRPERGQLVKLRWHDGPLPRRVTWGPRCYAVPWADGSVLVGATSEDVGFDQSTTAAGVHGLLAAAGELLPGAWTAALDEVRVGLRPATSDGLPIIGPLASAPNVVFATGHYRNGILLAPWTADVVARLVVDGVTDRAIDVTTPNRFGGTR